MKPTKRSNARSRSGVGHFFDHTGHIRRPPSGRLWREAQSLLLYHPAPPETRHPIGRDHVVLVVPGFLAADIMTRPLRRYLERCGFRVFGWGMGLNLGPTPRLLAGLRQRLTDLRRLEGGPISVIGVSLGGLFVRDLAYERADDIRCVITLASPFRLPTASPLEPLLQLCAPLYSTSIDPERLAAPLPMPSLAIYTRDDGLVAWQSCRPDDENGVAVEVRGSHVTICRNPEVMRIVAERLAAAP